MFDPTFYRQHNPDLSHLTDAQAWTHYVTFGLLEERAAHPTFCLSSYLSRYPDLRSANWIKGCHASALHHWNIAGKAEGRNATPNPGRPSATPLLHSPIAGYGPISITHALRRIGAVPGTFTGKGVIVAVLDSGLSLAVNRWVNPDELPDGRDNDGNTLIDDLNGWDFAYGDNIPDDMYGHGNIITQVLTNTAPGVAVLPLKVLSDSGYGVEESFVSAISYAISKRVHIINLSLNIPYSAAIEKVLKDATNRGILVCMAAGNEGGQMRGMVAIADKLGVLAVGCQSANSNLAGSTQNYVTASGNYTSLATPVVAGLGALLIEGNPRLGAGMLVQILKGTAGCVLPWVV